MRNEIKSDRIDLNAMEYIGFYFEEIEIPVIEFDDELQVEYETEREITIKNRIYVTDTEEIVTEYQGRFQTYPNLIRLINTEDLKENSIKLLPKWRNYIVWD